jgi:hypothetical protein
MHKKQIQKEIKEFYERYSFPEYEKWDSPTTLIAKDVKDIKERLLGRPSWTVTVIITLLSTLAFSALTFSFTVIHQYVIKGG